ncbi:MAG: hypothetical protein WC264_03120 [Candidatus Paceibacterota bacterium]|jgi:hypothetical protein
MIGKKLILLKNGKIEYTERVLFNIPNLDEIKNVTAKNSKRYGYIILIEVIRFYIKTSILLKYIYTITKKKIIKIYHKYFPHKVKENKEKEVSKFLRMVSDYKNKIKNIKDKIVEEENNY